MNAAGTYLLSNYEVVRVTGEDAETWLQGQITADIKTAGPNAACYALILSARGKIMADVFVLPAKSDRTEFWITLPKSEGLHDRLEQQIIMEDVLLSPSSELSLAWSPISTEEPQHPNAFKSKTHPGLFELSDAREGKTPDDALLGFRLENAIPFFGIDFGPEQYPQEVGLEKTAVSFGKGCYLGQEVVCTLESRGQLNRAIFVLETLRPTDVEAALTDEEGNAAGSLLSRNEHRAFGILNTRLATVGKIVQTPTGRYRIVQRLTPGQP